LAPRWRTLITIALLVLALDQVTKFLAVAELTRAFQMDQAKTLVQRVESFVSAHRLERLRAHPRVLVQEHLRFKYVENPGAAWGMFGGLPDGLRVPFFFGVSVVAICAILLFYRHVPRGQRLVRVALALVLGGALGNFVDRLLRGYVIDFIDLHWKNDPRLHWPTFNVADIGISVGVALLLSHTLFGRHPAPRAEAPVDEELPAYEPPRFVELPEETTPDETAPAQHLAADRRAVAVAADGDLVEESAIHRPVAGHREVQPPAEAGDDGSPGNRATAGTGSGGAGAPTHKE